MPPRRAISGRSKEPRQRFAEELRLLRTRNGDSLRRFGERLGWDWSLFGKMEKGETLGSPDVAQASTGTTAPPACCWPCGSWRLATTPSSVNATAAT